MTTKTKKTAGSKQNAIVAARNIEKQIGLYVPAQQTGI
jgi:hypothetical protein